MLTRKKRKAVQPLRNKATNTARAGVMQKSLRIQTRVSVLYIISTAVKPFPSGRVLADRQAALAALLFACNTRASPHTCGDAVDVTGTNLLHANAVPVDDVRKCCNALRKQCEESKCAI